MLYQLYKLAAEFRKENGFRKIFSNYSLTNVDEIKTWTTKDELRILYHHARSLKEGSKALEIGSYLGASTCYIGVALAKNKGELTCIDTWKSETIPGGEKDIFDEFKKNTYPIQRYLRLIRTNSLDLKPDDIIEKFNYVFIDGDHSYEAVKNDFLLVSSWTSSGAKVFFHDSKAFEGVTKVIGDALASGLWDIGGTVSNLFWIIKK
jgi:predicted O-methyltransferase YrrM